MSKGINLVIKEGTEVLRQKKRVRQMRYASVGSLIFVLLVSVTVYLINFSLSPVSLEEEKKRVANELTPLREKEAKLKVINNRVANISITRDSKRGIYEIISSLLGESPIGTYVEEMFLEKDVVGLKVTSNSLASIEELVNNVTKLAEDNESMNSLVIESLVAENTNEYSIDIILEII